MLRMLLVAVIAMAVVDAQALVPLRPCDLVAEALDAMNAQAVVEAHRLLLRRFGSPGNMTCQVTARVCGRVSLHVTHGERASALNALTQLRRVLSTQGQMPRQVQLAMRRVRPCRTWPAAVQARLQAGDASMVTVHYRSATP